MSISDVGSLAVSTGFATLAVSPTAIGDILVLVYADTGPGLSSLSSVSGGGVTTWTILKSSAATHVPCSIAYGVITATGSHTITVVNSGASYTGASLSVLQFTGNGAGTWAADGTGATATSTSLAGNYPSLTPAGSGELYLAMLSSSSSITSPAGSTSGFTYFNPVGASGNEPDTLFVYNPTASMPTAQSPAWSANASVTADLVAALVSFTPTPAYIAPRKPAIVPAVARAASW